MKTTDIHSIDQVTPRSCSLINKTHPEWGTFGVTRRHPDGYFEIYNRGGRVLFDDELLRDWAIVTS